MPRYRADMDLGQHAVIEENWQCECPAERVSAIPAPHPFEEQHYPISYCSGRWGFSVKTVRDWFFTQKSHEKTGAVS